MFTEVFNCLLDNSFTIATGVEYTGGLAITTERGPPGSPKNKYKNQPLSHQCHGYQTNTKSQTVHTVRLKHSRAGGGRNRQKGELEAHSQTRLGRQEERGKK
jgi:hypothetical protein